jgi:hypothetical protein
MLAGVELSSPACYLGEMSGSYVGQLEPGEVAGELGRLVAELTALLRKERVPERPREAGDPPPFTPRETTLARWIARLAATLRQAPGEVPTSTVAWPGDGALAHLNRLVTQVPDSELRDGLCELRAWLASNAGAR